MLGSATALTLDFNSPYWLGVSVEADPELTPRVTLDAAPYSLNAVRLDGLDSGDLAAAGHAHALDELSDVNTPAPVSGQVLTFDGAAWQAQAPVAGGDDWENWGDDIYRTTGKVGLGMIAWRPQTPAQNETARMGGREAIYSRLQVLAESPAQEGGIYSLFYDHVGGFDGGAAIYGLRNSALQNPGLGFAPYASNGAVTGVNSWGDRYTFGVSGFTYFDQPHTAGVLGGNENGTIWAALAYSDQSQIPWGLYTPVNGYFGGHVGVGTTSPDRPLEVNNPTGSAILGEVTYSGNQDFVGVEGVSTPADFYGIGGKFTGGFVGARGQVVSTGPYSYFGVEGTTAGSGTKYGVYGSAAGSGANYGVYGYGNGGTVNYAGYFQGNVHVNGTLSKAAGAFKIDHPLDPAGKTLSHSFVESPDMMNVYNGNVVLGADGAAWVDMPAWFEALNRDFRYQLTAIGGPGPNLHVAAKMTGNRFRIAGGGAGLEVSWQVTGIRQDAYANAHRIPVEAAKVAEESGRYLHPELFGRSESEAIGFQSPPVDK